MSLRISESTGFTIIEALFVLAIAGVFFLIVFNAIPALERSSRNNQRRQDISSLLQYVSHYELNNSGDFPNDCGHDSLPTCNSAYSNMPKLTYYAYDTSNSSVDGVGIFDESNTGGTISDYRDDGNLDSLTIHNYSKCDATNQGYGTKNGAGYNDVIALYDVETGSGWAAQCQQL